MLYTEEAISIGCKKYRELYPENLMPFYLEEQGVLGVTNKGTHVEVHVTFWEEGQKEPFFLFLASVELSSGSVTVNVAEDWLKLKKISLCNPESL